MNKCEDKCIGHIRSKAHAFNGRNFIVHFLHVLADENIDYKRSYISYQCTGCGMKAGCFGKIIKRKAENKSNKSKPDTRHIKRKPQKIQIVQIRNYKLV